MVGKFGLENGSGQLFKWRFKLTLSCHKSHCLDACAAAARLFVQGGCLPAEGAWCQVALFSGSWSGLWCLQPALRAQPAWAHGGAGQGCVPGASCLQAALSPCHILLFASYHRKKKQVGIYLLPYLTEQDPHTQKLL